MSFTSEPLIGKVIWNDLITEDLKAARRFYSELFGWTFDPSTTPDGRPYLLARSGPVYVAGMVELESDTAGITESRWLPYVSVSDVDASVSRATAAGATVAVAAKDLRVGRVAVIIDREGAVIGLARSHIGDPDDSTTAKAIGRVVWTELLSNAPLSAAQFYRDVIGYTAQSVKRASGEYIVLSHQERDRAGILKNPSEQAAPVWLTYFGVEDPRMAARRVEALGGRVILWPSPQLRHGTMAVVTDPTGALLVLSEVDT
ncbi:MAG: VOC family protein [Steroidobacteraceae bacterium]|nr:VOC family protein [Steroidobacteraceae bacterium]